MKILVLLQREWAFLYGIHIIEAIKKKYPEARFAGYVYKISTWKKIKEKYNFFDHLWLGYKYDDNINNTEIRDQFKNYDIESIEDELGIDSVWKDIIHSDRNLIYTPGKKWRYSLNQQVTDDNCINIVKLNYWFVKTKIFGQFNPDIIILPNFGSIFHNILFHYAKTKNVNCWMPTASKISNRVVLTNDKLYNLSNIFKDYKDYKPNKESINFSKKYINDFKENYIKPIHLQNIKLKTDNLAKNFIKDFIKLPPRIIKNYIKNKDELNPKIYRTLDNIKTFYFFKNFFIEYYNLYNLKKFKYDNFTNINDYLFMPLHVQPEVSTNIWAPLFTNQYEFIRQIAICLPNNLTLVIKEHPYMLGRRSINYYNKLKNLPNVKVISHLIDVKTIIPNKKCRGVVVISGTAGFEAALLGKPVYIFSETFYDNLNHVFSVDSMKDFIIHLKNIKNITLDKNQLEKIVSFLYDNSFELPYSMAYSKKINIDNIISAYLKKVDTHYNK